MTSKDIKRIQAELERAAHLTSGDPLADELVWRADISLQTYKKYPSGAQKVNVTRAAVRLADYLEAHSFRSAPALFILDVLVDSDGRA
jgi:hypothetical protein